MKPKSFYALSSFIFMIVGTLHLLRFLFQLPVTFGGWEAPLWVSPLFTVFAYWLGIHGLKLKNRA